MHIPTCHQGTKIHCQVKEKNYEVRAQSSRLSEKQSQKDYLKGKGKDQRKKMCAYKQTESITTSQLL